MADMTGGELRFELGSALYDNDRVDTAAVLVHSPDGSIRPVTSLDFDYVDGVLRLWTGADRG